MKKDLLIKIIVPILIISGGVTGARFLASKRQAPARAEARISGTSVKIITVHKGKVNLDLHSTGIVQPARAVTLSPQVAGRVQWLARDFNSGGFFPAGAPLFSLEKDDYELALTGALAEVSRAQLELATVSSRAEIARREWQSLQPQEPPPPLADYQPQLNQVRAMLKAAQATVSRHRLNLARTTIKAPFACRVATENIDPGQYLSPGQQVGQIKGTDKAEILIQLPPEELNWLTLPTNRQNGSNATITYNNGQGKWLGRVIRNTGAIDPQSQMASLVVEVDDPYNLKKSPMRNMDLAHGLFVRVRIHGRQLPDLIRIPRQALRDNQTVWLADSNNQLIIRPVKILRKERDSVMISHGLGDGDRVIISAISGAANGLQLKINQDKGGK